MYKNKDIGLTASILVLGLTFLAFQNCARTEFAQAENQSGVLKAESSTDTAGENNETGGTDPSVTDPDVADQPTVDPRVVGNLVECELGHPNKKVVYGKSFIASSSNASSTRVCMSENSCLKVLNAYAAVRDCSLKLGPASSTASPNSQCTKIFPGSKGTCHNAKIMDDAQVASLLELMAK